MLKIRLPESVMEGAAMKALWKETVIICLILNDIYSVQKEIVSPLPLPTTSCNISLNHKLTKKNYRRKGRSSTSCR